MADHPDMEDASPRNIRGDLNLLNYKVDQLFKRLDEITATFATKAEVASVRDDVEGLKSSIGWAIKTVLGAVFVAVVGMVLVKGGVPHP